MATASIPSIGVTVAEYLHTDYSPDRDYVDGAIEERNMGEYDHASIQGALLAFFQSHRDTWNIKALPELRLQVAETRFRVPDVMILRRDAPKEQIITHPPLLCVEVLSPDDRFGRMEAKIDDYLKMGVTAVWVIDSEYQEGYRCEAGHFSRWIAAPELTVPGTPIVMSLAGLLAGLD